MRLGGPGRVDGPFCVRGDELGSNVMTFFDAHVTKKGYNPMSSQPHPSSTKRASQKLIVPSPPGTRMGHGEVSLILGGLRTIGTSERGFSRTTEDHSHGTYNRATQLTPHFFFHSRSSTSHHRTSGLRFAKWRISNPR